MFTPVFKTKLFKAMFSRPYQELRPCRDHEFKTRFVNNLIQYTCIRVLSGKARSQKFQSETSSPTLLCIQDIEENVFGALISCPIKLWDHFYGTGETFLFTCQPQQSILNGS